MFEAILEFYEKWAMVTTLLLGLIIFLCAWWDMHHGQGEQPPEDTIFDRVAQALDPAALQQEMDQLAAESAALNRAANVEQDIADDGAVAGAVQGGVAGAVAGAVQGGVAGAVQGGVAGAVAGAVPGGVAGAMPGGVDDPEVTVFERAETRDIFGGSSDEERGA